MGGGFLSVEPGLLFWSIINFLVFLFALYFIGGKKFIRNIIDREKLIQDSIDSAEKQKTEIQRLTEENAAKLKEARQVIDEALKKAKEHADLKAQQIIADAQKSKEQILADATAEIEMNKQRALKEIRAEVADLVVISTEKIIGEKLDANKDKALINNYLSQMPSVN